ncbi:hypothetical protein CKO12_10235 [Chromatium okenii]|nr:type IVB secretion system protein IcmH/DotU [Chromatium okenii]MBK1642249.1 hypothetical protein [Chromatium okenii]
MTNNDPFATSGGDGPTIIRPMPGGRMVDDLLNPTPRHESLGAPAWMSEATVAPGGAPFPPNWSAAPPTFPVAPSVSTASGAINPLLNCANGILTVAAQVRGTVSHPDPDGLREGLSRQLREFEACARARGLADTEVLPARYMLCALVDEAVLDTPWGTQSVWSNRGLLISFHNETWGGEKFFTALERLLTQPATNLHL